MWNNGFTTFVGDKPLFVEKENLYLLLFEKIKISVCDPQTFNIHYRPILSNNSEIIKGIVNNHIKKQFLFLIIRSSLKM